MTGFAAEQQRLVFGRNRVKHQRGVDQLFDVHLEALQVGKRDVNLLAGLERGHVKAVEAPREVLCVFGFRKVDEAISDIEARIEINGDVKEIESAVEAVLLEQVDEQALRILVRDVTNHQRGAHTLGRAIDDELTGILGIRKVDTLVGLLRLLLFLVLLLLLLSSSNRCGSGSLFFTLIKSILSILGVLQLLSLRFGITGLRIIRTEKHRGNTAATVTTLGHMIAEMLIVVHFSLDVLKLLLDVQHADGDNLPGFEGAERHDDGTATLTAGHVVAEVFLMRFIILAGRLVGVVIGAAVVFISGDEHVQGRRERAQDVCGFADIGIDVQETVLFTHVFGGFNGDITYFCLKFGKIKNLINLLLFKTLQNIGFNFRNRRF